MPFESFIEGLTRGTRLVMWDKRGTGLSDPVTQCRRSTSGWTTCRP